MNILGNIAFDLCFAIGSRARFLRIAVAVVSLATSRIAEDFMRGVDRLNPRHRVGRTWIHIGMMLLGEQPVSGADLRGGAAPVEAERGVMVRFGWLQCRDASVRKQTRQLFGCTRHFANAALTIARPVARKYALSKNENIPAGYHDESPDKKLITACRITNGILMILLLVIVFPSPAIIVITDLMDASIRTGGIPSAAWKQHRALSPKFSRWAQQRIASTRGLELSTTDISGTEWPLFGSVFYLLQSS